MTYPECVAASYAARARSALAKKIGLLAIVQVPIKGIAIR